MGTFSVEIKYDIVNAQMGYCKASNCFNKISSIHHMLHNTEYNRKRFPLFINSPFNGIGLCYNCHKNKSHLFRITEKEAQMYENYLQELKGGNNE